MNIQEIVKILTSGGIEQNEANMEVKMLIEHFCNYSTKDIIMGRPLDYEKLKIVEEKAKERAKTKKPVQYIIGKAYFMGNFYKVTPDVLIPRDETEIVVRHAIELAKKYGLKTGLDIGAGSGCITCTLAEYGMDVTGVDISDKALAVAKENARLLHRKTDFIQSDLFSDINKEKKFDLIISNPPYIPVGTELQREVQFEPKEALFTSDDSGTEFYERIIKEGRDYLNQNGYIVFELGINQADIVEGYFIKYGYTDIQKEKDLAGIERVISAKMI